MDISFDLYDPLHIRIDTEEYGYLRGVDEELTSYVKGYQHMPKFKTGHWNGKVSLFNRPLKTFPYGLLLKILKYTKTEWSELEFEVSQRIKDLFVGIVPDNNYDHFLYKPYNYQLEAIHEALIRSKCIVQLPTASGKSFVITCIIDQINRQIPDNDSLILVPNLQLVEQFKDDMDDYGVFLERVGQVNASKKEFDKKIVISTWQSMKNSLEEMARYHTVIVDEVHTARADRLKEILQTCPQARFRIGMTGTMPTDPLEFMNVQSYLGSVLVKYTGKDLANMGYISHCTIKTVKIKYENDLNEKKNDYTFVRDTVFQNPYRLGLIKHLVKRTKNSMLILVEKVEKEGKVLEEALKEAFPEKKVIFLSGKDKASLREETRKLMNIKDDMVVISTYPIFQQGINIPSLRTILLASSTKSFIRVIQSLGRALRKHVSKELGGAELWDLCDITKYLKDHAEKRERHYIKEGHEIEEYSVEERSGVYAGL